MLGLKFRSYRTQFILPVLQLTAIYFGMDGSEKLSPSFRQKLTFCYRYVVEGTRSIKNEIVQIHGRCTSIDFSRLWNRIGGSSQFDEEQNAGMDVGNEVNSLEYSSFDDQNKEIWSVVPYVGGTLPSSDAVSNGPPSSSHVLPNDPGEMELLKTKDYEWLEERKKTLLQQRREYHNHVATLRLAHQTKLQNMLMSTITNHPRQQAFRAEIDEPD